MAYKIKDGKVYWEKWFENDNSELAIAHKNAYNKSIKEQKCVKLREGHYYYKGFEIAKDGYSAYPWTWNNPADIESECAKTKKECIETIDCMIKNECLDLCDLICV